MSGDAHHVPAWVAAHDLTPSDIDCATAREGADEAMKNTIYEHRVLAETAISRPVMKTFKAMIRAEGLFAGLSETDGARD